MVEEKKKRNTVGMRADRGWLPLLLFVVVGFVLGACVPFVVAVHDMWAGGHFRHYPTTLYVICGIFGAIATVIVGTLFAWAFDVIEEEYLDEEEEKETKKKKKVIKEEKEPELEEVKEPEKKEEEEPEAEKAEKKEDE